ncbi:site-specific integrase [Sulfurimonas sp. HSL-1716]|uniref:site-specific integrase n=1 Tax=Hydrocurvibacter sulfurireducens TaxID=3131937 RepID=UPI0031F7DE5E
MLSIKQIFDIASDARYSYITENIVEPFLMKKPKNSKKIQKERKPLSEENLKKLFTSKLYTDKLKHTLTFAPEKYWIPIIAGYSGMRQNEICQLYVEDLKSITTDMGEIIWYFDLNEEKDKHLKNENAFRLVPLHPKLIELGFIEYYNSIKNKQPRLWKNLRLHPKEERYNTDYGKNFMKYFRKHVTEEEDQVFHSLRHNVGDQLMKNAVHYKLPKDLMNRIMGHEPDKDMTSVVYSQGYGVEELYEGIKTLDFKDLIHLKLNSTCAMLPFQN